MNKKFITTTLPYINNPNGGHIGHAFEFVLADVIADYWRWKLGRESVRLNIGLDEHGQKIAKKALELGYASVQEYCDFAASNWKAFVQKLGITPDVFYRTSDPQHKKDAVRFIEEELKEYIFEKEYSGLYCVGCESFKTERDSVNGRCIDHRTDLVPLTEQVKCLDIHRFAAEIEDRLVDKGLSNELKNILATPFDFPITRKNVDWGVKLSDGSTLYVWAEALTNYVFAAGYYRDRSEFDQWSENSLQLCGKDNLKFQAYIFQAILLASGAKQTSEILVHGIILDERGDKMSKSLGNVVDPIAQLDKYGIVPLRYYLTLGLSTYGDSAYSEKDLVQIWNSDVVGGFGNLVARALHLVDIQHVDIEGTPWTKEYSKHRSDKVNELCSAFEKYNFHEVRKLINVWTGELNKRISDERPFDIAVENRKEIINEIYCDLVALEPFYSILLKDDGAISSALRLRKKAILFKRLEHKEALVA